MLRLRHPLALLAATAVGGAVLAAPAAAAPVQRVFNYTGAVQTWQVPPGVTEATFTLVGAEGGDGSVAGGLGAELRATLPVTPNATYEINVGGAGAAGAAGGAGGFNGGGAAGDSVVPVAGGGGGATDVRTSAALSARVLVAAGGGGGGANGSVGAGGAGGNADGNGSAGQAAGPTIAGGGGGIRAGAGGTAGGGTPPWEGVAGIGGAVFQGGAGASTTGAGGNGGGGGGGWFGGGGGGAGGSSDAATDGSGGGGGGGGESYYDAAIAQNVTLELAPPPATAQPANGVAVVSYEPAAAPAVRTQPSLSGVAEVGRQLTCETGAWSGSPTSLAIAWLRNGTPIANATAAQYTLQAADGGQQVACQVTATNATGSTVARTPAIGVPALAGPANTALPTVTGTAAIGSRVTCNPGTWGSSPTFAYTWLRNGTPIANQTQSTYTLARADAGMTVQCVVRATASGLSTTAQSVAVGGPARLVILNQTALVSRTGSVTVVLGCFGSTACRVSRVTATSGQVIARAGSRVVRAGATSRVALRLGRRGLGKLGRAGSSIPVRFVSLPEGGYGGNVRMTWVALRGAR